ncbi:MAG: hypothetical protein CL908_01210 [Deltaproteobacteria bacterium]|nr:hypothetical protein [Deltaproteobacteria bacterium]
MAKKAPNTAADALAEIEATGDRVADWAASNAALILGVIAGLLVLAAAGGFYIQHASDSRDAAADALAIATSQYRQAMGADPTTGGPVVEPANAELAERTRTEYAERFASLGQAHAGTAAGALAWLEAGRLQAELGRLEEAAASFISARGAAGESAVGALASLRIAALAENRGDDQAAAEAFERAATVEAYPLRAAALGEAARCWVAAAQPERALAAYQRLEAEYPDELVAPHIASLIGELRLSQ